VNRKNNHRSAAKITSRTTVDKVIGFAAQLVRNTLPEHSSATKLLIRQHDEVKALFERIDRARNRATKIKLFDELAQNLVAHDAIEREIFYPACERAMGMTELLGEALVEHGVVEFSLYQADQARKNEDFSFKCQVLSELVSHHVKEEEREFFPQVEKALSKAQLEQLGARMQERFEAAKADDFRTALHDNLNQVLAGALKPAPKAAKRTAKASKKTASRAKAGQRGAAGKRGGSRPARAA